MRTGNLLLLFAFVLVSCGATLVCCAQLSSSILVSFRLDDIADDYVVNCQKTVINLFRTRNLPLSIGIIPSDFGSTDLDYVAFIKNISTEPNIEICCHGYLHVDFSTYTLEQQSTLLANCTVAIKSVVKVPSVTTFIAPYNTINDDTIAALIQNHYDIVSSEVDQDPPPYNLTNPAVWHFPIQPETADTSVDPEINYGHTKVLADIVSEYENYGFAVVMLHPYEFCNFDPSQDEYTEVINETQLNELVQVLDVLQANNSRFKTLAGLKSYFSTGAEEVPITTAARPPPTTREPSSSTTGALRGDNQDTTEDNTNLHPDNTNTQSTPSSQSISAVRTVNSNPSSTTDARGSTSTTGSPPTIQEVPNNGASDLQSARSWIVVVALVSILKIGCL